MALSERVARLRSESLNATATLSPERARIITDFYQEVDRSLPVPIQRGMAFRHLFTEKSVSIPEGELIVGERGPTPIT